MHLDRPVLRPGLRLLRRPDGRWQVADLLLGPDPRLPALAAALLDPWCELPAGADDLLDLLTPVLVDRCHIPVGDDPLIVGARAALLAEHGVDARGARARRAAARVAIVGPAPWVGHARALLAAAGVGHLDRDPDVVLALHTREPDPSTVEQLLQRHVAHVWAGMVAGECVVGPFTDPGRTPCRWCLEAERSMRTPGWALLRRQHAGAVGVPEPVDPAWMTVAIAWAVADVVAWIDGEEPSTWAATITLDNGAPRREQWRRHPECGCSWSGAWWHLAV